MSQRNTPHYLLLERVNLHREFVHLLLEFLDAVVEHELELFELLRLTLERVDFELAVTDLGIFLSNLFVQQLDVVLVLLDNLFLLRDGSRLVEDVPLEAGHVVPDVLHFVFDQLELGLRLERHIVHLALVVLVLVLDGLQLLVTVLDDLLNRHLIAVD